MFPEKIEVSSKAAEMCRVFNPAIVELTVFFYFKELNAFMFNLKGECLALTSIPMATVIWCRTRFLIVLCSLTASSIRRKLCVVLSLQQRRGTMPAAP